MSTHKVSSAYNPSAAPTDTRCRLMELPAELRNQIFRDVVVNDQRTIFISVFATQITEPAITLASKQLRRECLPVFYGANRFEFESSDIVGRMLSHFKRKKLRMIKTILAFSRHGTGHPDWRHYSTSPVFWWNLNWKGHVLKSREEWRKLGGRTGRALVDRALKCPMRQIRGGKVTWIKLARIRRFNIRWVNGVKQWVREDGKVVTSFLPAAK